MAGGGPENDHCELVNPGSTWLGMAADVDHAFYLSSGICSI